MDKREHIDNDGQVVKRPKIFHEGGALKYDFMTSLQNIAMAKVISTLWMNQNTRRDIVSLFHSDLEPFSYDFKYEWQQIETGIISKISELVLPKSITELLKNVVPHLGKSVLNWIKYHDKIIFKSMKFSKYTAANLLSNLTWTARGKIDYAETAKKMIYNQDCCLSDDHKYKLACECCLENEIFAIAPKVVDKYYLQRLNKHFYPMVYFWTSHITDGNTNLSHSDGSEECINEFVLRLLLTNHFQPISNEIQIMYLWNKLNEAAKARHLFSLIKGLYSQDLLYSLLTNLDYEQQRGILKDLSYTQLIGIFEDWLWTDYFLPTVFHILDIMASGIYFNLIKNILSPEKKNESMHSSCKLIFKQLWGEGSKQLHFFNYHKKFNHIEKLIFSLSWEQDMDVIKLLLEGLSMQQKKDLIFGSCGVSHCTYLIQNDQWNLVELFIKYTISSDEDIRLLKQSLMNSTGNKIAIHFLEQENFDKIDYFLSWIFKSVEEIKQFRQSLSLEILHEEFLSILDSSEVDFPKLENRLKWCTQSDLEKFNEFKANIPQLQSFEMLFEESIKGNKFHLLDQVLTWCFLNNQQKIMLYKSNISKCKTLKRLVTILITNDNSFKLLDELTGWLFSDEQKVQEFKTWLLYADERDFDVSERLLKDKKLDLADKFINWCVASSQRVSIFKNAFMLSVRMQHILGAFSEDKDLLLLIKWLRPSKETTVKYKTLVQEEHFKGKLSLLLDEYIESHNDLIEDDIESVSQD